MNIDRSPVNQSLSRRSLLASAGAVALGLVAGVGRASALGVSPGHLQNPEEIAAATAAAISYLTARASVTTSNAFADVSKWVLPDSRDLIEFERDRFHNLGTLGNPLVWNGIIERTWSEATVLGCSDTSSEVRLAIRDWTGVQWRPAPVPVERTPEQEALAKRFPEKYGLNVPDFLRTESGFGTRHEMTMIRTSRGWLISQDGYKESVSSTGGSSPDYVEASSTSMLIATASSKQLHVPIPPAPAQNLLGRIFDYAAAANYGYTYAYYRNPAYTDFSPNDCANFVSQCFIAGGYPTDGTWARYTYAWINNIGLRNWLVASGRGYASTLGGMGIADIINYDWEPDSIYDHVAIVTQLPGPLVSCHSNDQQNVPYKWIASPHPGTNYLYTSTFVSY